MDSADSGRSREQNSGTWVTLYEQSISVGILSTYHDSTIKLDD